jgi:hypothetical protein
MNQSGTGDVEKLCTVSADMSAISRSAKQKHSTKTGSTYYESQFDIVLLLGLTEIKAQLCWKENVSYVSIVISYILNTMDFVGVRAAVSSHACYLQSIAANPHDRTAASIIPEGF